MRPRLEAVYFCPPTDKQYERLARVLEYSARMYCPTWDINVRRIAPTVLRAASRSESHAANSWKLEHWCRVVEEAANDERILLVDADTFVTGCLDPLWDREFDFAYTARDTSRFPLNGGVIAVRGSERARDFMRLWVRRDRELLVNEERHRPWRKKYGGMNQASLGSLLETGSALTSWLRVEPLPCLEWNCEDTCWDRFDSATKIVHVKSALRMAVFGLASGRKVSRLARMWRDLDKQARSVV
jgi:hypothetical protein